MRSIVSLFVVAGLLAGFVACQRDASVKDPPAAGFPLGQQGGEKGGGELPDPLLPLTREMKRQAEINADGPIAISSRETLVSVLPEMPGWNRGEPVYRPSTFGGLHIAELTVAYRAGKRQIDLRLTDTGSAPALLAPFEMMRAINVWQADDQGAEWVTGILGIPILGKYSKAGRRTELTFKAFERFLIVLAVEGSDEGSLLLDLAARLNMTALKKK